MRLYNSRSASYERFSTTSSSSRSRTHPCTAFTIPRNKTGQHGRSADRDVIELITELAKVCHDKSAAATLNRLGYKTGQGKSWNASRVAGLRGYHEIPVFQQ